jgi:hypothetical protein
MGAGTFSTLQPPSEMVEPAAVVAAETLMKFLRESDIFFVLPLKEFFLKLQNRMKMILSF